MTPDDILVGWKALLDAVLRGERHAVEQVRNICRLAADRLEPAELARVMRVLCEIREGL